jgi:Domain of Unknown Function (DUF928)
MDTQSSRKVRWKTLLPIALWLIYSLATVAISVAPATAAKPKISRKIRWKPPQAPGRLGIPGNRGQGGGQRSDCNPDTGITAIVPRTAQGIYWGQTASDRPVLWLNLPQGLGNDRLVEITVRELNGKPIGKQQLTLPVTPAGVISLPFPAIALAENQSYRWEVAFYCDPEMPDQPFVIEGQIQRVAPIALPADRLEQAELLADRGIWFDALTALGGARRSENAPNLTLAWNELLQSAAISGGDQINHCCQFAPVSESVEPLLNQ